MPRQASIERLTTETKVQAAINLDGTGRCEAHSGIGFLDHMLNQLAFHSLLDIKLHCQGDLAVDAHHSIEDIALTLGDGLHQALGERKGICRFGWAYAPMDEALARAVLDFSARPECHFHASFQNPMLGEMPTEMVAHFFKSLALSAKITLHLDLLKGQNDHHCCEAIFKAFALALSQAVRLEPRRQHIASTKGKL